MPKRNPQKTHSQDETGRNTVQKIRKDLEGLEQLQVMQLKLIRDIRRQLNELDARN